MAGTLVQTVTGAVKAAVVVISAARVPSKSV
jgi:hypothetical protein